MTSSSNDKQNNANEAEAAKPAGKLQLTRTLDTSRLKAMGAPRAKAVTVEVRRARGATGGRSASPVSK